MGGRENRHATAITRRENGPHERHRGTAARRRSQKGQTVQSEKEVATQEEGEVRASPRKKGKRPKGKSD